MYIICKDVGYYHYQKDVRMSLQTRMYIFCGTYVPLRVSIITAVKSDKSLIQHQTVKELAYICLPQGVLMISE